MINIRFCAQQRAKSLLCLFSFLSFFPLRIDVCRPPWFGHCLWAAGDTPYTQRTHTHTHTHSQTHKHTNTHTHKHTHTHTHHKMLCTAVMCFLTLEGT